MPSGDSMWSLRVVVPRTLAAGEMARPRGTVDAIECAAWSARMRRAVAGWREGDEVEVHGVLRRRFFRTAAGTASRIEVHVETGRIIRRAGS